MPIKVMIKRKWQVDKPEELLPLLATLRSAASEQPGYISGETLRSLDDPSDYVVISIWETVDNWKNSSGFSDRRKNLLRNVRDRWHGMILYFA
jgi:heme-degrading monooxygenase HmoA